MARAHFWSHILDEKGEPVQYADVSIYIAGSTSPAYVFLEEVGSLPQNAVPQLKTTRTGRYDFWVGDVSEYRGYPQTQKFKIYWEKGSDSGTIDYVTVLPIAPQIVTGTTSEWLSAAPTGYFSDIQHNLNNDYPLVQCWGLQTSEVEAPDKVEIINSNMVRVFFPGNIYRYVVTVVG